MYTQKNDLEISDKEFAVIQEISRLQNPTQRHIAQRIGVSLGLTNLMIKRLVRKGHIKIQEAPARTIMYTLTPKGLAEKIKKSYNFTLRTIDIIKNIKESIQDIISREYSEGVRSFVISGNGELSALVEIVFQSSKLSGLSYLRENIEDGHRCYLILSKDGLKKRIDVMSELAERGIYY